MTSFVRRFLDLARTRSSLCLGVDPATEPLDGWGLPVSRDSRKGMERFENELFTIEHSGMSTKIDGLSGWRCRACNEVEFDAKSVARYAEAGDGLVLQARKDLSRRNSGAFGASWV